MRTLCPAFGSRIILCAANGDLSENRECPSFALYEIEDIARFPRVQDFISYCRLVKPAKESNGKSYGHSGKRIGNAHLRWAFGEAIILMLKGNKPMQQQVQKMANRHGKGKALAILSAQLGRAVYDMLKNQVPFDQELFLRS